MNRLPNQGISPWWFAAALSLMLLSSASLGAQTSKQPTAVDTPVPGATLNSFLVCHPTSGTLPLSIQIISTTYNQTAHPRLCYGRVDLQTAGGLYMAGISAGEFNLPPGVGEFYTVSWIKPLAARIPHVGLNHYHLLVVDVSPPPYNQPPYPPAGGWDTAQC